MRRRDFITAVAASAAWPVAPKAQQAKPPTIGILAIGVPETFLDVFRGALRELGYIEGRSVSLVLRESEGRPEPLARFATELVSLHVDVLLAVQTPAVFALKQATREIPIVMSSGDPVGTGLVSSLSAPGGNITGVSAATAETGGKNVELLREMVLVRSEWAFLPIQPTLSRKTSSSRSTWLHKVVGWMFTQA